MDEYKKFEEEHVIQLIEREIGAIINDDKYRTLKKDELIVDIWREGKHLTRQIRKKGENFEDTRRRRRLLLSYGGGCGCLT